MIIFRDPGGREGMLRIRKIERGGNVQQAKHDLLFGSRWLHVLGYVTSYTDYIWTRGGRNLLRPEGVCGSHQLCRISRHRHRYKYYYDSQRLCHIINLYVGLQLQRITSRILSAFGRHYLRRSNSVEIMYVVCIISMMAVSIYRYICGKIWTRPTSVN